MEQDKESTEEAWGITMEQAEACIGRKVIYRSFEGCDPSLYEHGVITSTGRYVFVRYGTQQGSQATDPIDLKFDK